YLAIVLPTCVTALFTLAAGILLATCHRAPPHGAGMSVGRWIALATVVCYAALLVVQAILTAMRVRMNSTTGVALLANLMYGTNALLYLSLLLALCLLMRRIAALTGRPAVLVLTLLAAAAAALLRLVTLAYSFGGAN